MKRWQCALWLIIPVGAALLPWTYNRENPRLADIPFFYWYQLMWIPLSVLCTLAVYRMTRDEATDA